MRTQRERYTYVDQFRPRRLSADPGTPPSGQVVVWESDGTGTGDDGDFIAKLDDGSTVTVYDADA